jgi:hypothetical protein
MEDTAMNHCLRVIAGWAFAIVSVSVLTANPILTPSALISELSFSESGAWSVELLIQDTDAGKTMDSVVLKSHVSSSTIEATSIPRAKQSFVVLQQSALKEPFIIDRNGDSLIVEYYFEQHKGRHVLAYGSQSTAPVPAPASGQSIMLLHGNTFAISKSPSIGAINDTAGACSTLHGFILDEGGRPVPDVQFILDYPFTTSSTGEFTASVLARNVTLRQLFYKSGLMERTCPVQEMRFSMSPGSTLDTNLVLTEKLVPVDRVPSASNASLFSLYPNPAQVDRTTVCSTELPVAAMGMKFVLYDANGRVVLVKELSQSVTVMTLPKSIPAGIYIAAFSSHGKLYETLKYAILQ